MAKRPPTAADLDGAFLTTQEVAQALGISVARVRQMAKDKVIPSAFSANGKFRIYMPADVEKVKKEREQQ